MQSNPTPNIGNTGITSATANPGLARPVEIKEPSKVEIKKVIEPIKEVKVLTYKGKTIISNGFRVVNDKKFRHIRTIDGSTYDLTEEDYKTEVK